MLSAYLSGLAASAGLIIAIGAQNAFVLRQGLKREHTALVVVCCAMGDILCISAGTAGIGALVTEHPAVLEWLRWGGAAFLAAYAFMAAKRAAAGGAVLLTDGATAQSAGKVLAACLAFTFLNPHVYLDTVVLLGSLAAQFPGGDKWVFAAGACTSSVVWFTALGFGARLLRPVFMKPSAWRILDGLIAVFMAILALGLAFNPL